MFWLFILILAVQRIAEIIVAKQNEQKVKNKARLNTVRGITLISS